MPARLRNFNLSVLVTDAFMDAVAQGRILGLSYSRARSIATVAARGLWERLMRATYDYAEPGVIFIDRVNRQNNLGYCEEIHATNPCGEQPLPPYGACLLGSINLAAFVDARRSRRDAALDLAALEERVRTAVRFLDNVIDVSGYPLPAQRRKRNAKRRIGLGLTGLADTLIMLGVRYGISARHKACRRLDGRHLTNAAYLASAELAAEKGAFPLFERERLLAAPSTSQHLMPTSREAIAKHGIRNGCLTSIAPTGTISLFAGNVSSGIEPVFDFRYAPPHPRLRPVPRTRRLWRISPMPAICAKEAIPHTLPEAFVTADDLSPSEHLRHAGRRAALTSIAPSPRRSTAR